MDAFPSMAEIQRLQQCGISVQSDIRQKLGKLNCPQQKACEIAEKLWQGVYDKPIKDVWQSEKFKGSITAANIGDARCAVEGVSDLYEELLEQVKSGKEDAAGGAGAAVGVSMASILAGGQSDLAVESTADDGAAAAAIVESPEAIAATTFMGQASNARMQHGISAVQCPMARAEVSAYSAFQFRICLVYVK